MTLKEYLISARQPRMNPSLAGSLDTLAVVLEAPEHLRLSRLVLSPPGDDDVVVDIDSVSYTHLTLPTNREV